MAATDGSATPKPPAKATPTLRLSKYGRNYRNNLKRELDKLPEDARQEAIKNVAGRYYKEKNPYHDEHKEPLKQLDIGSVISADLEILNQFTQAWPLGQQWQLQQLQPKISKKMPKKTAKKDQVTHDPPDSSLTAKQTETLKISTPTIATQRNKAPPNASAGDTTTDLKTLQEAIHAQQTSGAELLGRIEKQQKTETELNQVRAALKQTQAENVALKKRVEQPKLVESEMSRRLSRVQDELRDVKESHTKEVDRRKAATDGLELSNNELKRVKDDLDDWEDFAAAKLLKKRKTCE